MISREDRWIIEHDELIYRLNVDFGSITLLKNKAFFNFSLGYDIYGELCFSGNCIEITNNFHCKPSNIIDAFEVISWGFWPFDNEIVNKINNILKEYVNRIFFCFDQHKSILCFHCFKDEDHRDVDIIIFDEHFKFINNYIKNTNIKKQEIIMKGEY